MAAEGTTPKRRTIIRWSQRKSTITLVISNPSVSVSVVEDNSNAVRISGDGIVDIALFGKVSGGSVLSRPGSQGTTVVTINKAQTRGDEEEEEPRTNYWPRLLSVPTASPDVLVSCDWTRWTDEDEDDDAELGFGSDPAMPCDWGDWLSSANPSGDGEEEYEEEQDEEQDEEEQDEEEEQDGEKEDTE